MTKHIIIYSHGFGVRKDDRGLFTDIAAALPGYEHIMFDYGTFNEADNTLTIPSLYDQADKLKQKIAEVRSQNPNATIDLICHSQGCIVASLIKPEGIRKFIFTGPPATLNVDRMLDLFANRPGSKVNLDGISCLKRADFSTTNVLPEYWKSLENINPIDLYNVVVRIAPTTLINATKDEIIDSLDFSGISPEIKIVEIETGHNFENGGREKLISTIQEELRND